MLLDRFPIQKMLCCGILLMFSLLQRLKICWGTNWGRNFAGQKKKEKPHFQLDFNDCYIPSKVFPMGWVQTTPLEWTIAYSNTQ